MKRERRYRGLQDIGCLACLRLGHIQPADMHHLLSGTHRRGDKATIPLCEYHHRGVWSTRFKSRLQAYEKAGPSLAHAPNEFRARFGSDEQLLAEANALLEIA